jgi:probable rRNA maturation factor
LAINFFIEDIDFKIKDKKIIRDWIKCVAKLEGKRIGDINYIFGSDEYVKEINVNYLKHDYYTDIVTFNYNESDCLNSDVYISIDRVKDNAKSFASSFDDEFYRVVIHGILHLLGYQDKDFNDQKVMRKKEEECINFLKSNFLLKGI